MSRERRRQMVDRKHPALSTVRQCALLRISRSSVYYRSRGHSQKDLAVMKLIDQQYPSATLSNCLKCQDIWVIGLQQRWCLIIEFKMTNSLRMQAVRATFLGLPAARSRS